MHFRVYVCVFICLCTYILCLCLCLCLYLCALHHVIEHRYQFAYWASLWAPEVGVSSSGWREQLKATLASSTVGNMPLKQLNRVTCGVCSDCLHGNFKVDYAPPAPSAPKLRMIGVDLNNNNIKTINSIQENLAKQGTLWSSRVDLSLIYSGVTNFTGTITSKECDVGDEDCSLLKSKKRVKISKTLPVTTVDAIVSQLDSQKTPPLGKNAIDMLLIDTEGNDPLVIEGASDTLRRGLVRCLIFEYHNRGVWRETSLHRVTESVEQFGYLCYFSVMGTLWPLNQGKDMLRSLFFQQLSACLPAFSKYILVYITHIVLLCHAVMFVLYWLPILHCADFLYSVLLSSALLCSALPCSPFLCRQLEVHVRGAALVQRDLSEGGGPVVRVSAALRLPPAAVHLSQRRLRE
jgi:hypothetical protein